MGDYDALIKARARALARGPMSEETKAKLRKSNQDAILKNSRATIARLNSRTVKGRKS